MDNFVDSLPDVTSFIISILSSFWNLCMQHSILFFALGLLLINSAISRIVDVEKNDRKDS